MLTIFQNGSGFNKIKITQSLTHCRYQSFPLLCLKRGHPISWPFLKKKNMDVRVSKSPAPQVYLPIPGQEPICGRFGLQLWLECVQQKISQGCGSGSGSSRPRAVDQTIHSYLALPKRPAMTVGPLAMKCQHDMWACLSFQGITGIPKIIAM